MLRNFSPFFRVGTVFASIRVKAVRERRQRAVLHEKNSDLREGRHSSLSRFARKTQKIAE
jgi:hypothetical protein